MHTALAVWRGRARTTTALSQACRRCRLSDTIVAVVGVRVAIGVVDVVDVAAAAATAAIVATVVVGAAAASACRGRWGVRGNL